MTGKRKQPFCFISNFILFYTFILRREASKSSIFSSTCNVIDVYNLHQHFRAIYEMEETKILFKKSAKKRPMREREKTVSSEEENNVTEELNKEDFEKTRELQKLRKKAAGTNIVTLALGKKISKLEEKIAEDPFNMNSGGLVEMRDLKSYKQSDDAFDVGTQFFKETHIRDEDDEMRKFIETEMDQLKGSRAEKDEPADPTPQYLSPEDAALLALPEHLRKSTFKKVFQTIFFFTFSCNEMIRTNRCSQPRCCQGSQRWILVSMQRFRTLRGLKRQKRSCSKTVSRKE